MQDKTEKFQEITAAFVAQLEAGVAPWVRPWNAATAMPHNITTGKIYNGSNFWVLALAQYLAGYESSEWVTYKQAAALGGQVRKDEKSTRILKYTPIARKDEKTGKDKIIPSLRVYYVFNRAQVDNLPVKHANPEMTEAQRLAQVEEFVAKIGATITHGGDSAYYSPTSDSINMPLFTTFRSVGDYYATLLHELGHWTGHKSRLDRFSGKNASYGSTDYAEEELVAELTAAFLCSALGIDGQLQHASYLGSWAAKIKANPQYLFTAGSAAQKAANHLMTRAGFVLEAEEALAA